MAIIRNIPTFIKLINSIRRVDYHHLELDEAREAGDIEKENELIGSDLKLWTDDVVDIFDITIKVHGEENIPEKDGCVYIANHQGYADIIALIQGLKGRQLGFIAKDSLEKVPYLGKWIKRIRGIFIKRGDTRESLKSMREGIELVKKGYNLVIFPEGTRSQGPKMGKFKPGSFKLATKAKAPIVPVTLSGSYKCFEEKGYKQPATIDVIFHPPIETKDMDRKELIELEKEVPSTIENGLLTIQHE